MLNPAMYHFETPISNFSQVLFMASQKERKTTPLLDKDIRILGLSEVEMRGDLGHFGGKLGQMYNAISRRYNLIGMVNARMPKTFEYYNRMRTFFPDRARWRAASSINSWAFVQRSRFTEERLRQWDGQYDLILQLHTLQTPGLLEKGRPYIIATDNTYMNSLRHWPDWVPIKNRREQEAWIRLEGEAYRHAEFLFPWSEFTRQSMINDYGVNPDRIIAAGAGANFVSHNIENKRYDTQTALFVGYEFERKGGYVLLEAWDQVRKVLPNAQLNIVGPRDKPDTLMEGVHWIGRVEDRQQLQQYYDEATVFVMPSIFEPWGHVFTEAMGMGLPCVGSDSCAMPEIIQDGETGLITEVNNAESLAAALITLLGDPAKAEAMGKQAYARMESGNTWDDVVDRWSQFIHQTATKTALYGG